MSDDQFTKLLKRLDKHDAKYEQRFADLADQLLKLYQHTEEQFGELRTELAATREEVHKVYDSVDGIAKRFDDEGQEQVAVKSQLNRHERWHHQVANKLGMKLEY